MLAAQCRHHRGSCNFGTKLPDIAAPALGEHKENVLESFMFHLNFD